MKKYILQTLFALLLIPASQASALLIEVNYIQTIQTDSELALNVEGSFMYDPGTVPSPDGSFVGASFSGFLNGIEYQTVDVRINGSTQGGLNFRAFINEAFNSQFDLRYFALLTSGWGLTPDGMLPSNLDVNDLSVATAVIGLTDRTNGAASNFSQVVRNRDENMSTRQISEPATLALLAVGLVGFVFRQRRLR